jgi:transcriptional regulator with XRE-family HTH domain
LDDPEKVIEQIGRRIAELRTKAGFSQADVAEKLKTTVSNYQRIEHGLQNLTIRTLVRVAGVLGAPTASLLEKPTSRRPGRGRPRSSP